MLRLAFFMAVASLAALVNCDCAYVVNSSKLPNPVTDPTPFIVEDDNVCAEFRGELGCCNPYTSEIQTSSYGKIDTVFGNSGGGCDICGVNLKRFWCTYSCSPRQSEFMQVGDYVTIVNPSKPEEMVTVEQITLWVESTTACNLFGSCARTAYAAQVSAMQTPAGFLNFQGANAIDDGAQVITIKFTDEKEKGLYIPDLDKCGRDVFENQTIYGFNVTGNCSCNSCKQRCPADNPFKPTPVLQGFNTWLVVVVWGSAAVIGAGFTIYRNRREKRQIQML